MRSFLVRKVNNFTKTQCLRAKVPNTYGTRLYNYYNYIYTSLIPQNLRNIIKKVAKISISQILMSNLSVKKQYFAIFAAF